MNQRSFTQFKVIERDARDRVHNRLCEALNRLNVTVSEPLTKIEHPNGVIIGIQRESAGSRAAINPISNGPFQVYQNDAFASDPDTDWRNVCVTRGTVNTIHPDFDDSFDPSVEAVDILIPVSQTDYKVWVECAIVITEGVTQGNVTTAVIKHGATPSANGWAAFPAQPNGNATTGQPADKFFIMLADGIETGVDSPATVTNPTPPPDDIPNPDYRRLVIPQPQDCLKSQWLDLVAFDSFCDPPNGTRLRRRMSRKNVG